MELTCLGDQMAAVMKELTNACDNDSSTEVSHFNGAVSLTIVIDRSVAQNYVRKNS